MADLQFQTKDTDEQYMDSYEIREDGTLWVEIYETEDKSPATKFKSEHPGKQLPEELGGILGLCGYLSRVNKRSVQVMFTGEISFYTCLGNHDSGWVEFSSYFLNGKLQQVNLVEHRPPTEESEARRKEQLDTAMKELFQPESNSINSLA